MNHYDELIASYCNCYKKYIKFDINEYKKHFDNQCTQGGNALYLLFTNNKKSLKLDTYAKRLSTLCKIICFLYREGLKENSDPQKTGLYIVDFHIKDKQKILYKNFVEKYTKEAPKDSIAEYEGELWEGKKVKFYQLKVKNNFKDKPLLPWGHGYIRIFFDSENKKLHVRTTHDDCSSLVNGITSYVRDRVIKETRKEPGYKKIHLLPDIDEQFLKIFPDKECKEAGGFISTLLSEFVSEKKRSGLALYEIIKILENSKDSHEYKDKIIELLNSINEQYRYPKKMYGNEVYIHYGDLVELICYLDYLKCINKNNDAEDFAAIIAPFLNLDTMIFDYNNFSKFIIQEQHEEKIDNTIYKETEALRGYVKESVIAIKNKLSSLPKPYKEYLTNVIACLELILKTKTPDYYLLHMHFFNAEEHATIINCLNKEINSYKKSFYPKLPEKKSEFESEQALTEDFQELNNEIQHTIEKIEELNNENSSNSHSSTDSYKSINEENNNE